MLNLKKIQTLLNEAVEGTETFVVDLYVGSDNKIRVFIDSFNGVPISECIRVSRHIEHNLDRDAEDFALDVSSAGLDQGFKVIEQYKKNIGRDVKVLCNDSTIFIGTLEDLKEDGISIKLKPDVKKKKDKEVINSEDLMKFLAFKDIKETKAVISFK